MKKSVGGKNCLQIQSHFYHEALEEDKRGICFLSVRYFMMKINDATFLLFFWHILIKKLLFARTCQINDTWIYCQSILSLLCIRQISEQIISDMCYGYYPIYLG